MPTLETTKKPALAGPETVNPTRTWTGTLADFALGGIFLALTFLLGMFPLKDTDFWWHLRTGDLIRKNGRVPVTDWYTFAAADHPWIDLHWGFEVLLSLGYEAGGIVALNVAKCAVTTLAMLLLLTSRRKGWPLWVMAASWLPALFVLSGRMYVRPETLSLLYLAIELAILFRWKERPELAYGLPVVFLLWVNSHGLFVVGLVVLALAVLDAALTVNPLDPAKRRWWKTIGICCGLSALATVMNPYGLRGTLFPIELAQTMANPIFAASIAELMPVPVFIEKMGLGNVPLRLHLLAMLVGGLSFVVPMTWRVAVRAIDGPTTRPAPEKAAKGRKRKGQAAEKPSKIEGTTTWSLRPFRLLLFVAFTLLGWKATRNTHQFAAVVGTVTAWNFAEWAAAINARRPNPGGRLATFPRLATFGLVVSAIGFVAGGGFYKMTAEGRTVGLGEEPRWFPHDAAKRAGASDMPARFVCFHNGHAGLYEYYNGPDRKVMADARLEVIGPKVYAEYLNLLEAIRRDEPGWNEKLVVMENPGILVDNVHSQLGGLSATLLADRRWSLVHFDPIAALFVPISSPAARHPVDFAVEHFQTAVTRGTTETWKPRDRVKSLVSLALQLSEGGHVDTARPLVLLGAGLARTWRDEEPSNAEAWKYIGLFESLREPIASPEQPIARYLAPFDPVFDLTPARAAYALRESLDRDENDVQVLLLLSGYDQSYGLNEAALPILERILSIDPPNQNLATKAKTREGARAQIEHIKGLLGPEPPTEWKNLAELDRNFRALLDSGRVAKAADLLESAYPIASRPWDVTDRLATLRLHIGRPDLAKSIWEAAVSPPRPGLRTARAAAAELVADDTDSARRHFRESLKIEPKLFEALFGLAVLERDAGHAADALSAARNALNSAPNDVARGAAQSIIDVASHGLERPAGGRPTTVD